MGDRDRGWIGRPISKAPPDESFLDPNLGTPWADRLVPGECIIRTHHSAASIHPSSTVLLGISMRRHDR